MSTILKALKKLEQDYPATTAAELHGPVSADFNRGGLSKFQWHWPGALSLRWIVALGAVAGLAIGLIVSKGTHAPPSDAAKVALQIPVQNPNDRPTDATVQWEAVSFPDGRSERIATPLSDRMVEGLPADRGHAAAQHGRPLQVNPVVDGGSEVSAGPQGAAEPIRSRPRTPEPAQTQPRASTMGKEQPPIETDFTDDHLLSHAQRLMDSRLQVQAIAWSPAVEDRMAVINNQIVRQGKKVDGFVVVVIGQDQVVVKDGPLHYIVPFGSR